MLNQTSRLRHVLLGAAAVLCGAFTAQADNQANNQVNYQARDALDLFDTNQLVALGEHHGMVADDRWILSLIDDPRFAARVDVLSIELGAGTHQDTLDRYIRGEDVSADAMQRLWSDGTHSPMGVSYSPFYEELVLKVRTLNQGIRADNPIRVIAGDPGVDWDAEPLQPAWLSSMRRRDTYWGEATQEAVRAGDTVMMIGGFGHFGRQNSAGAIAATEAEGYAVVVPHIFDVIHL